MKEINEHSLSDRSLVQDALKGDVHVFKEIIKTTERLVAGIVCKMIPHAEDRKDLAQDIYLKAFQKLKSFRFESKLSTWIAQIAYNTCINHLKKKKLILLQDDQQEKVFGMSGPNSLYKGNETDVNLLKKELRENIHAEIENLPPVYRVLITLYHNEELPYQEIARITNLPEGTVKNYLFRARKLLREKLLIKYNKEGL